MRSSGHLLSGRIFTSQYHLDLPPPGGLTTEVQSDSYHGEDEIVRMPDNHHRVEKKQ
jgi:hypothetical protein